MTEFLRGNKDTDGPSKTQVKQDMLALQDLGAELLKLSGSELNSLNLEPGLREALREHGRMPTREARRRHLQHIGRLLREGDGETVRAKLAELRSQHSRALSEAEEWRQRLIDEDSAMTEWIDLHPHTDRQALRMLVRNARRERDRIEAADPESAEARKPRKPRKQAKLLFQTLRELASRAP